MSSLLEGIPPCSVVNLGAPGTGKSTLAASFCELIPPSETLLLVTKPGEEASFGYLKHGLKAELYFDEGWLPTLKRFGYGAYLKLLTRVANLLSDEKYGLVIMDCGTDAVNLIEHTILGPSGIGSPGDLDNTQQFYRQLRDKAQELVGTAALLATTAAKRPKWVVIPWHVQPPKEGSYVKDPENPRGPKIKTVAADEKAQGIEYEGMVLPQIEGGYRRKLAADVSIVVYHDVVTRNPTKEEYAAGQRGKVTEFVMQVRPNEERHAKLRLARALPMEYLPNDATALVVALKEAMK